tara:strand:- start:46 stop:399 length:354 start_codon:yes stop_codon:yes gene_type:complete
MGCDTYLIRKQNLPCSETRSYIYKETILWDGDGSEIADYLTDYELRRCVEPDELLEEVQNLLSQETLGSEDEYNRTSLTLLSEVLSKEPKTKRYLGEKNGIPCYESNGMEYELQLSY